MKLTRRDIDILLEAMSAWETRRMSGEILMSLMMYSGKKGNEEETERKITELFKKNEDVRKSEAEIAVLIKAKLIELKTTLEVEEVTQL